MLTGRGRHFGVRGQPFGPAGGEEIYVVAVVHSQDRVQTKIRWLIHLCPVRRLQGCQNLIHAVRVFIIRDTFAAIKDLKRRIMVAMFFRVKYFHGKTILPASVMVHGGTMDLFDAIHGRQTITQVKPDAVPRDVIEKLLSAAVQAPNHYKVRPWRFVVLTGDGRRKLGDVMAASFLERNPATQPEGLDKTRSLPLRAPVVIAVGVDKPSESKIIEMENITAASAAGMNILLAANALGLGAIWRTGDWARDP